MRRFGERARPATQVSSWISNPAAVPFSLGASFWVDADDLKSITESSGSVSQWNDKSSNNRNVSQGTALNQPTTGTDKIGGRNAIQFDGSNDRLISSAFNIFNEQHAFIVIRGVTFPNAYNSAFSQEGVNTPGATLLVKSTRKLAIYLSAAGNNVNYDGSGAITLTAGLNYLLEYSYSGTQLVGYVNGSTDATVNKTVALPTDSTAAMHVCSSPYANRTWSGAVGEFVYFNRVLTGDEQTEMRNYLNLKWLIY